MHVLRLIPNKIKQSQVGNSLCSMSQHGSLRREAEDTLPVLPSQPTCVHGPRQIFSSSPRVQVPRLQSWKICLSTTFP